MNEKIAFMLETSARLLELLSLFQAHRYWTGTALCERLEVTPRTLRRDVDRLRRLGYPVNSTSGAGGGCQLGAGSTLPPLLLEDDEAVAATLGLSTVANGTVAGLEEASLRALAKVRQVLPQRLQNRVNALQTFIVPLANQGPAVDAGMLSEIASACRDCVRLKFRYRSKDGEPTQREAEPHRLVYTGRRWYLAAWDTDRADWRTFRLDRMEGRVSTGERFLVREAPGGDFAAYVGKSVSYTPYPLRARVLIYAPVEKVAERIPTGAGTLEAAGEGTCLLHTGAASLDTLSVYLALMNFDFMVEQPAELVARVRELSVRFGRATGG
jgi:predicted DNA-binding transcriptional regulator YafY